jgi:hypothetical protein
VKKSSFGFGYNFLYRQIYVNFDDDDDDELSLKTCYIHQCDGIFWLKIYLLFSSHPFDFFHIEKKYMKKLKQCHDREEIAVCNFTTYLKSVRHPKRILNKNFFIFFQFCVFRWWCWNHQNRENVPKMRDNNLTSLPSNFIISKNIARKFGFVVKKFIITLFLYQILPVFLHSMTHTKNDSLKKIFEGNLYYSITFDLFLIKRYGL